MASLINALTGPLGLGIIFLILAWLLLAGFLVLTRQGLKPDLRPLPGYEAVIRQVGQAIESGGRVHVSLGQNGIVGSDTGVTLAGLSILDKVAQESAISDRSPVATSADVTTLPVMTDTIRRPYRERGALERYENTSARLVALDSLGLAAGTTSIVVDDEVRANIIAGTLGSEAALIAEAGLRRGIPQVVASDRLETQVVGYVMADHVLIGEEMFAARAYLDQEPASVAGALAQDVLRWAIIAAIGIGSVLASVGLLTR
jgi:hypothetical protein